MAPIKKIEERHADGRRKADVWPLPLDETFLETLFRDLFHNHWQGLTFGPMIAGGAYELRCPEQPQRISYGGGYLTVHWGRFGHFHLCLGESRADPETAAHRRPSKAELVRGMDKHGNPVTWSLRVENGKGESTLSIYFPNPFLTDEDGLAERPDWSRLALWHYALETYAGHQPDGRDTAGQGFGH
ncbi:hypothetical protein MB02_07995 [Croceicoccus estronivorus]|uniref:DUF7676 family protein n=1 Tax=Croceicoccus estronivorus TaxID=1172626 RepID=UPI0008376587|nr:hypothetical protein [Croceicoccus estronivorus]OCC24196.1 hypothetical protein MB02_07995 [Croceicoccus estronivorus]